MARTLTKADIAQALHERMGMQHYQSKLVVDDFFDQIRTVLESGHSVKISGFGNFILNDKKARPGRNPKTGEQVEVSPRRVVTFKAGQKLKEALKGSSD